MSEPTYTAADVAAALKALRLDPDGLEAVVIIPGTQIAVHRAHPEHQDATQTQTFPVKD